MRDILSFQSSIYMLNDKRDSAEDRLNTMKKLWKDAKEHNKNNQVYLYGMLPEKLIPAAYIPFYRDDNINTTFNILTLKDKLPESYYDNTYKDLPGNTTFDDKKKSLKDKLKEMLTNLDSPNNPYNMSNEINFMVRVCMFFWTIIFLILLKVICIFFPSIYIYILLSIIIILLFVAIMYKIFNTLQ